jgi:hypothetical protein
MYCGAQTVRINRVNAWQYCALASNRPSGDNCAEKLAWQASKSGHGFAAIPLARNK